MHMPTTTPVRGPRRHRVAIAVIATLSLAFAACSSDSDSKAKTSESTSSSTSKKSSPDTSSSSTSTGTKITPWETVTAPSTCECSDGSPYEFYVRKANPKKVLFFLQGGGACFDATSCAPGSSRFATKISDGTRALAQAGAGTGIFEYINVENPLKDYSVVYAPYCTGDVHLGTVTHDYGNGVVVEHKGNINAKTALAEVHKRFPDAEDIVVAGESAGSIPTPLYAGELSDSYPDAKITVFADGSGGYPNDPGLVGTVGNIWGTGGSIPDWPELKGMTVPNWNFAELFISAGKHNPNIVFSRYDYAFDHTQIAYAALAGVDAAHLDEAIDATEELVEAKDVQLLSYLAPGDDHTILHKDTFYTKTVNDIRYVDWFRAVLNRTKLNGKPVADNHCVDCSIDAAGGSTVSSSTTTTSAAAG